MKKLLLLCLSLYGAFALGSTDVKSQATTKCPIRIQVCDTFTKFQSFYDVEIKLLSSDEKKKLIQICNLKSKLRTIGKEQHDHLMTYLTKKIPEALAALQSKLTTSLLSNHQFDLDHFLMRQEIPSQKEYEASLAVFQKLSELEKSWDDKFKNMVHQLEFVITNIKTIFQEKIWSKMAELIILESEYEEFEKQKNGVRLGLSEQIGLSTLVSVILDYQLPRPIFDTKAMKESLVTVFQKNTQYIEKNEATKSHYLDGCPPEYKKYEKPWEGQHEFLYRLKKMELACPPEGIEHAYSVCSCITFQNGRSIAIVSDQKNHYSWMYGLSKFVEQYNIMPSEEFYDYVMNYPLDEIYGTDPRNKPRKSAYSADGKYIAAPK
jgi:hypothetical protein